MAQRILGLDVGTSSVKGAVVRSAVRNFEVVDFVNIPILREAGEEDDLAGRRRAVEALLQAVGQVDQVITCLPGEVAATRVIDLPFSEAGKIEQTLGFQLEEATPLDLDDMLYDYQFVTREKEGSRLVVGLAPQAKVVEYLAELSGAGVDPRVVMQDGLPPYHLYNNLLEVPEETQGWALVDVGDGHTTISFFLRAEDGEPRLAMARTLRRGGAGVTGAIADAFGVDRRTAEQLKTGEASLDELETGDPRARKLAEAAAGAIAPVVIELRRSLRGFNQQYDTQVQLVHVTGGGSQLAGFAQHLAQRLGVDVVPTVLAKEGLAPGLDLTPHDRVLAKPLALALRGMGHDRYSQINLRKGDLAFKGDLKYLTQRMGFLAVAFLVILVLLSINVFSSYYVLAARKGKIVGAIQKSCKRIVGRKLTSPHRCLAVMLDEIQKVRGGGERALIPAVSSYDVFLEVYSRIERLIKDKKLKVELTSLRIDPKRADIEGETNSYDAVNKIVKALKAYRCLSGLRQGRVRKATGGKGKIEFSLRAQLKC